MKELEDYNWFPSALRNFQTEYIGYVVSRFRVYDVFTRYLNQLDLPTQPMHDLCSGSGAPAIAVFHQSHCFNRAVLSDKFPNPPDQLDPRITYSTQPADVLRMKFEAGYTYTMFNSFHHFSDKEKQELIRAITASGSHAFFVEILQPRVDYLLKVLLASTVGVMLLTPFVQPFSWSRILFTYLLPIAPLLIAYDGIVSVLKSRTARHYNTLFHSTTPQVNAITLPNGLAPLVLIQIKGMT